MIRPQYHPLSIALHWLMFILVVVVFACIELYGRISSKADATLHDQLLNWHIDAGLLVLLFLILRIGARHQFGTPRPQGRPLITRLAQSLHLILYVTMALQPVLGVISSQSAGYDVEWFGWVLPTLVAKNEVLHTASGSAHYGLGNAVYFMIGAHILAALWHHYIQQDGTLARMLRW